jgi:hypothetical protein
MKCHPAQHELVRRALAVPDRDFGGGFAQIGERREGVAHFGGEIDVAVGCHSLPKAGTRHRDAVDVGQRPNGEIVAQHHYGIGAACLCERLLERGAGNIAVDDMDVLHGSNCSESVSAALSFCAGLSVFHCVASWCTSEGRMPMRARPERACENRRFCCRP